jgi:hypothetical protein
MTNECVGLLGIRGYLPLRKIFKMDCLDNWNKDLASKKGSKLEYDMCS